MAGFGLPNFGQLAEAFKKAKQIQQDAQKLQDELENMEIEGKSDDEMIKVWISGNQLPLKVEVQKNILNTDKEKIEKNLEQNMTNKVNIERLQKDVDKMLNDIEKLKDADREIKNGH